MEPFLIAVTFMSLALAALLGVVAWKLLREKKDRTAARVEALEALAFEGLPDSPARFGDDGHEDGEDEHAVRAFETPAAHPFPAAHPSPAAGFADRFRHDSREIAWQSSAEPLFASPERSSSLGRRLLGVAALALVVTAGLAAAYAWRAPELVAAFAGSRDPDGTRSLVPAGDPGAGGRAPLELLSLRHEVSRDGTFTLTGLAQNPSRGQALDNVVAVVYLFDGREQYFATGRTALGAGHLSPGEETPFVITVTGASTVIRYRIGFRRADGGVVAHVDHRGQPLEGTTGETADDVALPNATSPASMPRRSEG